MNRRNLLILAAATFAGCSASTKPFDLGAKNSPYLNSGTIVVSRQMPAEEAPIPAQGFSPVVGYIPPMTGVLPASNELWIEVDSQTMSVSLFRGDERVKSVKGEGSITLAPGKYALQYKQKFPTWYAPNAYFEKRSLTVPAEQDRSRFMKGALGDFALYPSSDFIIHSAPFYSSDVGGLRIPAEELQSLFSQLPIGSSIVVK